MTNLHIYYIIGMWFGKQWRRLRRDQIVFVNKTEDGATDVYSLYDFKDFRENMDAEKGNIQGRFNAVPYVDSSVSSIKQLLEG